MAPTTPPLQDLNVLVDKHEKNDTESPKKYLVIGQAFKDKANELPGEKHLVAITDDITKAKAIIGEDYIELIKCNGVDPLTSNIWPNAPDNGIGYITNGYAWTAVPVCINTILNFSL